MIPTIDPAIKQAHDQLVAKMGGREGFMGWQLCQLASSGQPTDVTFYRREPILDVTVDPKLLRPFLYGWPVRRVQRAFEHIRFSDGTVVSLGEIWTLNPMPKEGFTAEQLAAVDMTQAEVQAGLNGETIRQMIRETYHCRSQAEEDFYVRRWIAS